MPGPSDLAQMQSLPLEAKAIKSLQRIKEWLDWCDGNAYVSYSGGKDSEVLLHLVHQVDKNVPVVFFNTRMEFPEIVKHVKQKPNITIITPKYTPKQVIDRWGYPVVSKIVSQFVSEIRSPNTNEATKARRLYVGPNRRPMRYILPYKWRFLLDAPFKISDYCCNALKKNPAKSYEKRNKVTPFIGTKVEDSISRRQSFYQSGCNTFKAVRPQSRPLSFWTDKDIFQYIKENNLPLCSIYGEITPEYTCTGYSSTGCVFCTFGAHMEPFPNRFQRLKQTHPKLWKVSLDTLGLRTVLDYINVPYE